MTKKEYLVITSIAGKEHPILKKIAAGSMLHNLPFILIGDAKSPNSFELEGCDFYSIERQRDLNFTLAEILPINHYARKNLGYLIAMSKGAEVIIETDDDNLPLPEFWGARAKEAKAHLLHGCEWVNVYKHFTESNIWPRGFPLEHLKDVQPELENSTIIDCPIQQGLADENPDVDAIYRFILPLPVTFNKSANIALGKNSFCPFNSQNTTWFKEAFMLMYLPSYCSFRMTDIWRSFIAQRIAWSCGWPIMFHQSTVRQERNDHQLMHDFRDEIVGYVNNAKLCQNLKELKLKEGVENVPDNMILCYQKLVELDLINMAELDLLNRWIRDVQLF